MAEFGERSVTEVFKECKLREPLNAFIPADLLVRTYASLIQQGISILSPVTEFGLRGLRIANQLGNRRIGLVLSTNKQTTEFRVGEIKELPLDHEEKFEWEDLPEHPLLAFHAIAARFDFNGKQLDENDYETPWRGDIAISPLKLSGRPISDISVQLGIHSEVTTNLMTRYISRFGVSSSRIHFSRGGPQTHEMLESIEDFIKSQERQMRAL